MAQDPRELEILEADWRPLRPHHERGALFFVAPEASLEEVARAVVDDRKAEVRGWLEEGTLSRPTEDRARALAAEAETARFRFAIVQPYVFAQPIEEA